MENKNKYGYEHILLPSELIDIEVNWLFMELIALYNLVENKYIKHII